MLLYFLEIYFGVKFVFPFTYFRSMRTAFILHAFVIIILYSYLYIIIILDRFRNVNYHFIIKYL